MNRNEIQSKSTEITERYYQYVRATNNTKVMDSISWDSTLNDFFYMRVWEIKVFQTTEGPDMEECLKNLYVGLCAVDVPVSFVLQSDGNQIEVYCGVHQEHIDTALGMLKGAFPQISFTANESRNYPIYTYQELEGMTDKQPFGGFIKGNPDQNDERNLFNPIDLIVAGMQEKPWRLSVFANPIKKETTVIKQQAWLTELANSQRLERISVTESDGKEALTSPLEFPHGSQYIQKVRDILQQIDKCLAEGTWRVVSCFSASTEQDAYLLGGLLTAAYHGNKDVPEKMHAVYFLPGRFCPVTVDKDYPVPYQVAELDLIRDSFPQYSTYLSSGELSRLLQFPSVDVSGFSVSEAVLFDVSRKKEGSLHLGRILNRGVVTRNFYSLDADSLNRHCLVVGLTGSGKTNTIKHLLLELTAEIQRPFLIVEPAKKEYWDLYNLGYHDLQVYSIGSFEENALPFCINPFECAGWVDAQGEKHRVPIQTHIDFIFSAFKASFIMYTPMPYVLEKSIYGIYEDCGWDVYADTNRKGKEVFPTMEDLYHKIPLVVDEMGYDSRMRNDLIGSLQARIDSMRVGTKGSTLNVRSSFPFHQLLEGHVVIEMEDVGDDDVKAFMISLLLISLLEIRRQQPDAQRELKHLLLVEEAHRLLKNVTAGTGENADPRGASVEFFCNILAELRSKGQGFVVADQIPSKLAPDLVKNTNLKIAHRMVSAEERELMGGAMHMTPQQTEEMACFEQGCAAVYSEGDNRPKLIKAPYIETFKKGNNLTRSEVLAEIRHNCYSMDDDPRFRVLTDQQTHICRICDSCCDHQPQEMFLEEVGKNAFYALADQINPWTSVQGINASQVHTKVGKYLHENRDYLADFATELCVLQELFRTWKSSSQFQERFSQNYLMHYKNEWKTNDE